MKIQKLLPLLLLFVLFFGTTTIMADEDHHDEHEVADHCDTPTDELLIKADTELNRYDKEEYLVEKNTCYELKFENQNDLTEHDVSIDAIDDHDNEIHFNKTHIHVANSTDGENGVKSMHIMTPDADTELTIYCSVEGHQAGGMEAILVVGDGNSALPIDPLYSLIGLLFVAITIPRIRKKS